MKLIKLIFPIFDISYKLFFSYYFLIIILKTVFGEAVFFITFFCIFGLWHIVKNKKKKY